MPFWRIKFKIICQNTWNFQEVWTIIGGIYFAHKFLCKAVHVSIVTNNMRFKAKFCKIAGFPGVINPQSAMEVSNPMTMYNESVIFSLSFDTKTPQIRHSFLLAWTIFHTAFSRKFRYPAKAWREQYLYNKAECRLFGYPFLEPSLFKLSQNDYCGPLILYQPSQIAPATSNRTYFAIYSPPNSRKTQICLHYDHNLFFNVPNLCRAATYFSKIHILYSPKHSLLIQNHR